MKQTLYKICLSAGLSLIVAACAPIIPGTFVGTISDTTYGGNQALSATLTVAQNGDSLSGVLISGQLGQQGAGGYSNSSGLLTGRVVGSIFTGGFDIQQATYTVNNCVKTGTLRFSDDRIYGSLYSANCGIAIVDVSKNGSPVASPTPTP